MCGTFNLGLMYEEGKGTYPDQEKAFKLYTQAAEQGHAASQAKLGLLYSTPEYFDERLSCEWYNSPHHTTPLRSTPPHTTPHH